MAWNDETDLGRTDLTGTRGPCAGRADTIARLRAAWCVPGSLTVLLGPVGIGKRTVVGQAQMDDIVASGGATWGMGAWSIDTADHTLADAIRRRAEKWGLTGKASIPAVVSWIEDRLGGRDGLFLIGDVDARDVAAGHVPLPGGQMRTVLLSTDPALPKALAHAGRPQFTLLELGPLQPEDDDAVLEALRDEGYQIAEVFDEVWPGFCAALGRHPWTLHLLALVLQDDDGGGHVAPGPLLARLQAAGPQPEQQGFPRSAEALVRFAVEQLAATSVESLVDWAAAGWPDERLRDGFDFGRGENADDQLHAWGLLLPAGRTPAAPVVRVARTLKGYRLAQSRAAALAVEYLCEGGAIVEAPWYDFQTSRLQDVLVGMHDVGHQSAAVRLLTILARRLAGSDRHHVAAVALVDVLPVLQDPFDIGLARATLGWLELDLDRPDAALGHLRLAAAAFERADPQLAGPARYCLAQPGARQVVVPFPKILEKEPLDFAESFFPQDKTPQTIEEADARLHYHLDSLLRTVVVEDRRVAVEAMSARARAALGQAGPAWRDLRPWLERIRAIGLYAVQAETLEAAAAVALEAGDEANAGAIWTEAAQAWQRALQPAAAAQCWEAVATVRAQEAPALRRTVAALRVLDRAVARHWRSERDLTPLVEVAHAAGRDDRAGPSGH